MLNRFERLCQLPTNQYIEDSPIILAAGALLKDNETGSIITQLKFQSVSEKRIKAVKVTIAAYDISHAEVDGVKDYQYLELDVSNGQEFGSNKAIVMPNSVTRSFAVTSVAVVFEDGTVWKAAASFDVLPAAVPLSFRHKEILDQYRIATNNAAQYIPSKHKGIWQCTCGRWNKGSCCSSCHISKDKVFAAYDIPTLIKLVNIRLAADAQNKRIIEEEKQVAAEKKRAAAEKKAEVRVKRKAAIKAAIKKVSIITAIAVPVIAIVLLFSMWLLPDVIQPAIAYRHAEKLLAAGQYDDAAKEFEVLIGYKDSASKISECKYLEAKQFMDQGNAAQAAFAFFQVATYKDSQTILESLWGQITLREVISANTTDVVGLKVDGLVVSTDEEINISSWKEIIAVSGGDFHTVGLKSDGTAVAKGDNEYGQCYVKKWRNIVAISAGSYHTVGLKADGTVVATGSNEDGQCDVTEWENIIAISAGSCHTVGLKADGTVVATGHNYSGSCDLAEWTDIVAISAGDAHTIGLKSDGTVVAKGYNRYGECDVKRWKNIVAISTGSDHTIGLKADGTVVATGKDDFAPCDVAEWTDIVAISAGEYLTVGLKADGTVVIVGYDLLGDLNSVTRWENIKLP